MMWNFFTFKKIEKHSRKRNFFLAVLFKLLEHSLKFLEPMNANNTIKSIIRNALRCVANSKVTSQKQREAAAAWLARLDDFERLVESGPGQPGKAA